MEIILNLLFVLMRFLDFVTTPIFNYKAKNNRQFLPPIKNDLLRISATELSRKIRNRQISSYSICEAYIDRIKEVNPILNAVVEDRFNEAIKEAKQVDSYLQTTSLSTRELEKIKPLLGVPITIKETCSVKGMSLCVGLKSRLGYKADTDGEVVARLKICGAIVLLVSNTPELCLSWETYNHITGATNNPYDTTCTAGGSSGGEGALLGAGASLIGVGSDVGGSIRLPAMFNGVFGHKPTPRVISVKGHWPAVNEEKYFDIFVIGPLTRYACDLRLMVKLMCNTKMAAELRLNEKVNLSKLHVFFMEDLQDSIAYPNVSPEIKLVVRKAVKYLSKECGAIIEKHKFEDFKKATIFCTSELHSIKEIPDALKWENANFYLELLKSMLGKSKFTFNLMHFYTIRKIYKTVVSNYLRENKLLKQEVIEKLGSKGVIIIPTSLSAAHKHNQLFFKNIYGYLVISNALGLPTTAVPCGFNKEGMPIGIQVIAAPYHDRLCLAVAEELEKYFSGWVPPPEKD